MVEKVEQTSKGEQIMRMTTMTCGIPLATKKFLAACPKVNKRNANTTQTLDPDETGCGINSNRKTLPS